MNALPNRELHAGPATATGDEALGAWLVEHGRLRVGDLDRSRRLAEGEGLSLSVVLPRLGLVSEKDLAEALIGVTGVALFATEDYPDFVEMPDGLSPRFLRESRACPVPQGNGKLTLVMADPRDRFVLDSVAMATGLKVEPRVGLPADIAAALARLAESLRERSQSQAGDAEAVPGDDEVREEDIAHLRDMASEAPVIRLVNSVLARAVEARASDVHIEPFEDALKIRLRIDGILHEIEAPSARSAAAVISRVKIMARLNIAERRLPQDGRITLRIMGKELDLRVSTVPTLHGESVVLRLLDKRSVVLDFEELGFDGKALSRFLRVLESPHGIILVTGPTGSGKSTTLYTALGRLNTPERKIVTVEDPVEYQIEGINQIQVKPQIGLTFATALRSIVRQDPDIIMVGEMRDLETAQIAVQSALTGHLVLSTLHTNDAAGSISRLLDMGVEDYLLTSTVNGILAQRLVRRLCPDCKEPVTLVPEVVRDLGLDRHAENGNPQVFGPGGCPSCSHTGYRGRLAIVEFLVMSDSIRSLVMRQATAGEIAVQARAEGMATMYEDGMGKVARGLTTLEEVLRVTEG